MSNVANLQDRLSQAFGAGEKPLAEDAPEQSELARAFSRFDEFHLGEEEPAQTETSADEDRDGILRLWLGGGGMLASAIILGLGLQTGVYALTGALGAVMCGSALIYLLQKRKPASRKLQPKAPAPERAQAPAAEPLQSREVFEDRHWEENERASLLGSVHDALGDIALVRDMDRRILYTNDTFRKVTGCARPEGRSCEEIGLAFRPHGEPDRFDVEIATAGGQRIFVWCDVVARDSVSGQLVIRSVARDVTEERTAAIGNELARIRAETTSAAKSRLLATVSHEIRTPLSGIIGMAQLLDQTSLTPEQTNYLNGIRQSGQALTQLVDDLLDFSTIEVGRFSLHPQSTPLRPLIESVVEMLSHRAHEKGIEIASIVAPQIPETLDFDPARLRQVLFNVIGNAVKFTHQGGILIEAAIDVQDLIVTVTDTGSGMTTEEQARIFGEFEQVGDLAERSAGTGLGLAISARICHEFGGSLTASSEKDRGSVFTIRMPHRIAGPLTARRQREGELKASNVLLMAPAGPASNAVIGTIHALGGQCVRVSDALSVETAIDVARLSQIAFTDIIVDHRLAAEFSQIVAARADFATGLRKIFLVSPEQRNSQPVGVFDAWLIRPLRERSLVDVLCGRMRGMEKRDAINDNQPGFGAAFQPQASAGLEILLAEDDPVNALLVRTALQKGGHSVRLVGDFEQLRTALTGDSLPDLVVTDLSMPGGNGLEFLTWLRGEERRRGGQALPVIVLSADTREDIRRQALLQGANRVFSKPVDPARLLSEIGALAPMRQARLEAR